MKIKVYKIRTRDNKEFESVVDVETLEKSEFTYKLFYPSIYKYICATDFSGNILFEIGNKDL